MKKATILDFYTTYKLYIFPLVVILSSLFLIVFIIYPQTVKLINGEALKEDIRNKSKFLESKAVALEAFDSEDLSHKVGVALSIYPVDKDFGNLLGLLQELAIKSGFSITTISFASQTGKTGTANSYGVKFEVKGSKILISNLINSIEAAPRIIRVEKVDVASRAGSRTADVSLDLKVLFSELPKAFGSADSPVPELNNEDLTFLASLERKKSVEDLPPIPSTSSGILAPTAISPRGKVNPFE